MQLIERVKKEITSRLFLILHSQSTTTLSVFVTSKGDKISIGGECDKETLA